MDPNDDLWTAIRRMLPGADELAAAVAAELGDPIDDVRLSVFIGTIAMSGQLGPEAAAAAAIEAELGRLQAAKGTGSPGRLIEADSLADLLVETQALEAKGSLDLETIVAIQRASGAIAARTDRPLVGAAAPLRSHAAPDLGAMRRCNRGGPAGPAPPRHVRPLPPPVERTHLARRHRRLSDRRARHPRPRGGVPSGCAPGTPRRCRRRRRERSPTAPRGGATRSEPGPRVPAGRDRAQPRERSEPRASGHRRGGPRTARRTDRSPGRVDRPGRGGRRYRNPSPGRAATPGSHLLSSPVRIGPV